MNIIQAIHDQNLFRPFFRDLRTWYPWLVVLKSIFGLTMTDQDFDLYRTLTKRTNPPTDQADETWLVVGRRGGKSFIVSVIAVYLACFRDYSPYLNPGERGIIMIIATDRRQARVIMRHVTALLEQVPMLKALIERQDSESVELTNHITIEIHTANFRAVRGYTVVAALCDEIAFWRSEDSANPAEEILTALRPAMATIPNSLLLGLGTPYRRCGPMYDAYKKYYGQEDESVLVVQAESRTMNPTVPQSVIDAAYERDPSNANAEYGAEFRRDISSFMNLDWLEQAVEVGCYERSPQANTNYVAFCDPSGGAHDSFTLAIAHKEEEQLVLDLVREYQPPFNPSVVVEELAEDLTRYRCNHVVGDRYSGEWVREAFRHHDIHYKQADRTKSEIYLEALPLFATGTVRLLDHRRLVTQLAQLERKTHRSGKDSVDHPLQGRDDVANSACGAVVRLSRRRKIEFLTFEPEECNEAQEAKELRKRIRGETEQEGWWLPV